MIQHANSFIYIMANRCLILCHHPSERSMMRNGDGSLFRTEKAKGRKAFKLFAFSMLCCIMMTWVYRGKQLAESDGSRWLTALLLGLLASEIWFAFYWLVTQTVRWNPVHRYPSKEKLYQRSQLPKVDMFVCTADPIAEPPALVVSTVLSLMAYNYPAEKLSLYLSDDGGSILTFYALWEASLFAKHWIPFCKNFNVELRSPAVFFSKLTDPLKEWYHVKNLYEEMVSRIDDVVELGRIPEKLKEEDGFSRWHSGMTSRNHEPILKILLDGRDPASLDMDGNRLPTLVYMAREKRPEYHHNFKAGAMNALIRVSSVISNAPFILNVDCDMYSNNSDSIFDSLCFFLDEEKGGNIAFVQYPQCFDNLTKNDLYAGSLNVVSGSELPGFDGWGGPPYIGTGCFHRREALCGRIYGRDYKENWNKGTLAVRENASILEQRATEIATCTYEHNTLWGKQMGLKYGCAVEDVVSGLAIHCKGWRSVYYNPQKKAFLGTSPTTLRDSLTQHKRWAEGQLQIVFSKNCSFIAGHNRMKLGHQMAYGIYNFWPLNSLPTLYYIIVHPLCLLNGVSLFPKISSPWVLPFAYVFIAKNAYSLAESLMCGDTVLGWWNSQRMWLMKRIGSYFLAIVNNIATALGFSRLGFAITSKATDDQEVSKRYEKEMMEFGSSSPFFTIIGAVAMLNLICFVYGMKRAVVNGKTETLMVQILLTGVVVLLNIPVYEGLFLRKDKGRLSLSTTLASLGFAMSACLLTVSKGTAI
ncbi:hypothetical protein HPP92_022824 [Vanilla planifolia]|uniref:Cellulose synthase-like protein E1 n=1 Tax=Vanilla planifolia TaxID=51239 RepID=A0A835PU99_VANPL|nr:hypothetical protein HPP92_022824 [Vanilla planifolia]